MLAMHPQPVTWAAHLRPPTKDACSHPCSPLLGLPASLCQADSGWMPCFSQLRTHSLSCSHFTGLHLSLTVQLVFPSEGFGWHMAGNARLYVPAFERLHVLIQLNSGRGRSQGHCDSVQGCASRCSQQVPPGMSTGSVSENLIDQSCHLHISPRILGNREIQIIIK